jgi:hypothetical protein
MSHSASSAAAPHARSLSSSSPDSCVVFGDFDPGVQQSRKNLREGKKESARPPPLTMTPSNSASNLKVLRSPDSISPIPNRNPPFAIHLGQNMAAGAHGKNEFGEGGGGGTVWGGSNGSFSRKVSSTAGKSLAGSDLKETHASGPTLVGFTMALSPSPPCDTRLPPGAHITQLRGSGYMPVMPYHASAHTPTSAAGARGTFDGGGDDRVETTSPSINFYTRPPPRQYGKSATPTNGYTRTNQDNDRHSHSGNVTDSSSNNPLMRMVTF